MSLQKRVDSFRYAFKGLVEMFANQPNVRIHLAAAVAVAGAGIYFNISALEWVALVICIAMVFAAEAVNTALEYLTDLVSPGHHPLAGKVKDVAAAAVLVTAFGAAIVGLIIFTPKFASLFR